MDTVYTLSDKGRRERAAEHPTLPAELRELLHMVDGQRSREDLLASVGKNSVTVGGLRWLTNSGYIMPTAAADLEQVPRRAPAASRHGGMTRPGSDLAPASLSDATRVRDALSQFMVRAIRRHLGETGYAYRRQIERAPNVEALLPHLEPVLVAIQAQAGRHVAAEFADTAALILRPLEG